MVFNLSPKTIFKTLSLVTILLAIANLASIVARMVPGHGALSELIALFDFDREQNIPTLYSSINLMFSAILLGSIALQHKAKESVWIPWAGLSGLLGFLAIDETASFHEQLSAPVQQLLDISGAFYYVWTIPYISFVGIFFLLYFRFLMRLPSKTRTLFIASGGLFIAGAAGFEVIGNMVTQTYNTNTTTTYRLIATGEELLEMFGVITFIYALFDYIVTQFGSLNIQVRSNKQTALKPKRRRVAAHKHRV